MFRTFPRRLVVNFCFWPIKRRPHLSTSAFLSLSFVSSDDVNVSRGCLLSSGRGSNIRHDRAVVLVNWIGDMCTWVDSPLNYVSTAQDLSSYGGVAVPFTSLSNDPVVVVLTDFLNILPVTARSNQYVLLITGYFSRRAARYAVTALGFMPLGWRISLSNALPLSRIPGDIAFGNGPQFCSDLSCSVCRLLSVQKLDEFVQHDGQRWH